MIELESVAEGTCTTMAALPSKIPSSVVSTMVIASLGYFVDLFDLWLFSLYRVDIFQSLQIEDSLQSGCWAINAQLVGLLAGGLLFGWLADRKGRRKTLLWSILCYSLGTLAMAGISSYTELVALRFVTGLGLAGELGIAATLIFELVSVQHRWLASLGLILIGLSGSLAAATVTGLLGWRHAFLVGGLLGLLLLALRRKVTESPLFKQPSTHRPWAIFHRQPGARRRLLALSAIGLPITALFWLVTSFSPELSTELGLPVPLSVSETLLWMQGGYILGDLLSILLSHWTQRRRLVVGISLGGCALSLIGLCLGSHGDASSFLGWSFGLGLSAGFWGVLLATCSEQFGSEIRAGASTLIPNIARASPLLLIAVFSGAAPAIGTPAAILGLGLLSIAGAFWGLAQLRESYGAPLDWFEETPQESLNLIDSSDNSDEL
jgi:putative MFS transporter